MKIEYKVFTLNNGNKDMTAIVNEPNGETLSSFLYLDVRAFEEVIKQGLDDVLEKKKEAFRMSGNACLLDVHGEQSEIYDLYADDENYYSTRFTIHTRELMQVVDEWCSVFRNP